MTYALLKNKRITFTFLAIVFRVLLDHAYVNISEIFEYLGIVYAPRPLPWIIFSYALLILIRYTSPQNHTRPSNIILLFLFIISYIPITTLFALNAASSIVPLIS